MNVNSISYEKDSMKVTNGGSEYVEGANRTAGTLGIQDSLIKSIKRSRQHSRKAPSLLHPLSSVSTSRPSCNIDRIFSVGIDRSIALRSLRKRLPAGKGKLSGIRVPVVIDALRMRCPFTGSSFFFIGIEHTSRWALQEEQLSNDRTATEYRARLRIYHRLLLSSSSSSVGYIERYICKKQARWVSIKKMLSPVLFMHVRHAG